MPLKDSDILLLIMSRESLAAVGAEP